MKNELKKYLERFIELSDKESDMALQFFEYQKFPKHTLILRSGDICSFEAYIKRGCAREFLPIIRETNTRLNLRLKIGG